VLLFFYLREEEIKIDNQVSVQVLIKVSPSKDVTASTWGTWKFNIYPKENIKKGSTIRIEFPFMWTFPQAENPSEPGYIRIKKFSSNINISFEIIEKRFVYLNFEDVFYAGEKLTLIYGDTLKGNFGARVQYLASDEENKAKFTFSYKLKENEQFKLIKTITLDVVPDAPDRLVINIPASVKVGKTTRGVAMVQDKWGNLIKNYRGQLFLSSSLDVLLPKEVVFGENNMGRVEINIIPREEGFLRVNGIESKYGLNSQSNPLKCSLSENCYKIYFGDLHHHSTISDGMCSIDKVYSTLRDITCLDFASVIDHDYHYPHIFYERGMQITNEDWETIKQKADDYYKPGNFVTFVGYEWTGPKSSKDSGRGDVNVYYLKSGEIYRRCEPGSDVRCLPDLWKKLKKYSPGVITIPHHTASGWGLLGSNWDHCNCEMQPVVEIYSTHGASEYYNNHRRPIHLRSEGHIQEALKKGYWLGFVGGSDCHSLNLNSPNVISNSPFPPLMYRGGLTAVLAKDLSRESIFSAIKKRRTWATTGARILIDFKINEHYMGEKISIFGPKLKISITVIGTNNIKSVELLKNNSTILSVIRSGKEVQLEIEHEINEKSEVFFYVRVTQTDGEQAWSSPIWIKKVI